jgi:hypothetical protein
MRLESPPELLVWTKDGCLAGLEYAWFGDMPPATLPNPNNVEVTAIPPN